MPCINSGGASEPDGNFGTCRCCVGFRWVVAHSAFLRRWYLHGVFYGKLIFSRKAARNVHKASTDCPRLMHESLDLVSGLSYECPARVFCLVFVYCPKLLLQTPVSAFCTLSNGCLQIIRSLSSSLHNYYSAQPRSIAWLFWS